MFEVQTETAKAAVDTLSQAAEQQVADDQQKLDAATGVATGLLAQIADLQSQLKADVALLAFQNAQGAAALRAAAEKEVSN